MGLGHIPGQFRAFLLKNSQESELSKHNRPPPPPLSPSGLLNVGEALGT